MKKVGLLWLGFALVLAATVTAAAPATETGRLVMSRCTQCHSGARICRKLGKHNDYWIATVTRMKTNGAKYSAEEKNKIIEFLSALKPDSQPVCR